MKAKPAIALLLSLCIHGLIAAGIAIWLDCLPQAGQLAQLDLTSVDLSFAETPDELAKASPASAAMPQSESPKPPMPQTAPPEPPEPKACLPKPPEQKTYLPKPPEPKERFDAAPNQARIDAPPKPIRPIRPNYPKESRRRGEQGEVTLEIDVSAHGTANRARVAESSGFPMLDEAALDAARATRFTPAKCGDKSVPSTVRLSLRFKLK